MTAVLVGAEKALVTATVVRVALLFPRQSGILGKNGCESRETMRRREPTYWSATPTVETCLGKLLSKRMAGGVLKHLTWRFPAVCGRKSMANSVKAR